MPRLDRGASAVTRGVLSTRLVGARLGLGVVAVTPAARFAAAVDGQAGRADPARLERLGRRAAEAGGAEVGLVKWRHVQVGSACHRRREDGEEVRGELVSVRLVEVDERAFGEARRLLHEHRGPRREHERVDYGAVALRREDAVHRRVVLRRHVRPELDHEHARSRLGSLARRAERSPDGRGRGDDGAARLLGGLLRGVVERLH
mmetsp:Transcript_19669/g.66525  ORF Transcript_19669/g.66525 Transcript_19669/m.66525 type:complete len:204 (-) Transcript_19669:314-925(-)